MATRPLTHRTPTLAGTVECGRRAVASAPPTTRRNREGTPVHADDASTIGARARRIRRRRGLSLDVVAGLAGISETYLSMLELGRGGSPWLVERS